MPTVLNLVERTAVTGAVRKAGLGDITPVFNLILAGAGDGHFSNRYLEPVYMAGLGIQLFSVVLFGRLRLPDGSRHRASLRVVREGRQVAGFLLAREEDAQSYEITMCAVDPSYRRRGVARALLGDFFAGRSHCAVFAECLPASAAMKKLLLAMGFRKARAKTVGGVATDGFRRDF